MKRYLAVLVCAFALFVAGSASACDVAVRGVVVQEAYGGYAVDDCSCQSSVRSLGVRTYAVPTVTYVEPPVVVLQKKVVFLEQQNVHHHSNNAFFFEQRQARGHHHGRRNNNAAFSFEAQGGDRVRFRQGPLGGTRLSIN